MFKVFIEKLFSVIQNLLFRGTYSQLLIEDHNIDLNLTVHLKILNQVVHSLESSVDNVYVKKTIHKIEDFWI